MMPKRYVGDYPVTYAGNIELILGKLKLERIMCSVGWLSRTQKQQDIRRLMKFEGCIFLDNGMFQRGSYKKEYDWTDICQYRQKLTDWYASLQPDIASSLDVPSYYELSRKEKLARIAWSVLNYGFMRNELGSIPLVLGSSIYSQRDLDFLKKCLEKNRVNLEFLGLGGQVPILRSVFNNPQIGKRIMRTLFQMSKSFREIPLHVYGLGEHRWYLLIRLLGAWSSDYASYTAISGRGKIIIPGLRPKFISKHLHVKTEKGEKYYTRPSSELFKPHELLLLKNCKCPICKNNDFNKLEERRDYRIIHNLYVTLCESRLMDELCEENSDSEMVRHVISRLSYDNGDVKPSLNYALKLYTQL